MCVSTLCWPRVKVSPGIAALHSNNPQVERTQQLFVCKRSNHWHIVRDRKHVDVSQSQGEETGGEQNGYRRECRGRKERSSNRRGFAAVSKSLLQLVNTHFCYTAFFSSESVFKNPITLAFCSARFPPLSPSHSVHLPPSSPPLLLHHHCPPL